MLYITVGSGEGTLCSTVGLGACSFSFGYLTIVLLLASVYCAVRVL